MLGTLDAARIEALLGEEVVGRIGCHAEGRTYVVPITYVYADGCVYGVDVGNSRVQKFTPDGDFLTAFGSFGSGTGQLHSPWGIDIHENGAVYVTDRDNYRVEWFVPVN